MTKIAFVFPGQGSQAVGMLNSWADNAAVQNVLQEAGQDIKNLINNGPAEELNLTDNTQPVMLAAGYAIYQAWLSAGGKVPDLMAGHSLGEYTALTAAGVFGFTDAVKLVRIRAQAMQLAVPVGSGSMAAILGLTDKQVDNVCKQAAQGQVVEAVNFNAPAQVVIAGHTAAIERACSLAKEAGAKRALLLPVSAPFHSSLLKPAAAVLADALSKLQLNVPEVPVINNVDVAINQDTAQIVNALVRQAWHPVRWVETIQRMQQEGVTHVVECGPGKVLTGLVRRIEPGMMALSLNDPASLQNVLESVQS